MRTCGDDVVEQGDDRWSGAAQNFIDMIACRNFVGAWANIGIVRGYSRLMLDDEFTDIERLGGRDRPQHPNNPVIIEPIGLRLRWWYGNESGHGEPIRADRRPECLPGLADCTLLMLPFRPTAAINGLLEVQDELVGRTEAEPFACGVFAEEQAGVSLGQVRVVMPCEIVDLCKTARKGVF